MNIQTTLNALPAPWPFDLFPQIGDLARSAHEKIVVLDDDPTGTQTVHHVPVVTRWDLPTLTEELGKPDALFYILTNSRALQPEESRRLTLTIAENLRLAAQSSGKRLVLISRSDSTLRGHFPSEIDALAEGLQEEFDACLIIPYFLEGGRFTLQDIHYVAQGEQLIPAGETEFARDATFGYHTSNLREWVQEKTAGRVSAGDVASISLDELRQGGPDQVLARLLTLTHGRMCVVNAACDRDLEVLALACLRAEAQGKRFVFRSAASFVRVRAAISPQPLLDGSILQPQTSNGGLIIVGSHVPRTTTQLSVLQATHKLPAIEILAEDCFDPARRLTMLSSAVEQITATILSGKTALVFTSRAVLEGADGRESLAISRAISNSLVEIVQSLTLRPRFLVAKGGITSSDIVTQGLRVVRAEVLGQILPGVPVWRLGEEARFPGLVVVVFPGNVGDEQALAYVTGTLTA